LIASDQKGVTFKWKDYRLEGPGRYKVMTLATHEFIHDAVGVAGEIAQHFLQQKPPRPR
jgi:hypothetical protein